VIAVAEELAHLELTAELAGVTVDELVLPAEHHVVVGGLRLHCLDWGGGRATPVLFLHGGCLTARTWDLVCLALREDRRCLALDQRGHGDSEWSPALEYRTDDHVRDVEGVLDHFGVGRAVLVGQSMGALNAVTFAARHPARVAGVVAVDVAPRVDAEGTQRIFDFVREAPAAGSLDTLVELAATFNSRRDRRLLRRSLLHNLRPLPDGLWSWKYDRRAISPEAVAGIQAGVEGLGALARSVECPALVVRGALSDVVSDAGAAAFADAFPDGRRTSVPDAGHTVQGDNPRGLIEALRPFLDELDCP
jgi:pimeloyl-ACP methyl ester carboxylesterase